MLSVDFGGTKVAVTSGSGREVRTRRFAVGSSPHQVLGLAQGLAAELGVDAPAVVSVATPGTIVDGNPQFSPNVPGWDEVNLHAWAAETWRPQTILLSNDVNAAAHAELAAGALRGVDIGLYINLGTGIAAAVVVDGRVIPGAHQLAGEVGYGRVGPASDIAWHSAGADLELLAGGAGFRAAGIIIPTTPGTAWLHSPTGRATRDALDELARHLSTAVLLLDPQVMVFGGGLAAIPAVTEHLQERVRSVALGPVDLVTSRFGAHASVLGALTIGTQAEELAPR